MQRKILNSKCPTLYDLKPTANKISYTTNWPRGQNIKNFDKMPKLLHYWVLKNKTKKDFVWYIFGTEPTYLLFLDSVRIAV